MRDSSGTVHWFEWISDYVSGLVRQKRVTIGYDNNHLKISEAVRNLSRGLRHLFMRIG